MRVFISSPVAGMERERDAAARATRSLGDEVRRSEDFPATDLTPRQACLAGVRWADAVVLLLGGRYGDVQDDGLSATHEEYREARERRPVLAFVQDGIDREPEQQRFIEEVEGWASGRITAHFRDPEELRDLVTRALHELEFSMLSGPSDPAELLERAQALIPQPRSSWSSSPSLTLVVVAGPRQVVLRPAQLEEPSLERDLLRDALLDTAPVLTTARGTTSRLEGSTLVLEQEDASVSVDELANIRVTQPATTTERTGGLPALIEEDVCERARRSLVLADKILARVDPVGRLAEVLPVLSVSGASHHPWLTREQYLASPHSMTIPMRQEDVIVITLAEPVLARPALSHRTDEIVDDLIAVLRRRMR
jgi:hypothetical protein